MEVGNGDQTWKRKTCAFRAIWLFAIPPIQMVLLALFMIVYKDFQMGWLDVKKEKSSTKRGNDK